MSVYSWFIIIALLINSLFFFRFNFRFSFLHNQFSIPVLLIIFPPAYIFTFFPYIGSFPMSFIIFEISRVYRANWLFSLNNFSRAIIYMLYRILKNSIAIHFSIFPLSLVKSIFIPKVNSFTRKFILNEFAIIIAFFTKI